MDSDTKVGQKWHAIMITDSDDGIDEEIHRVALASEIHGFGRCLCCEKMGHFTWFDV